MIDHRKVEEVIQGLDRLIATTQEPPLTHALTEIRDDQARAVEANFEGQHDPDGEPWAEPKSKLRPVGRKLLQRSGGLKQASVLAISQALVDSRGYEADPAWPPHGQFHADGTAFIAQREFSGFGEDLLDQAVEKLADRVVEMLTF